MRYVRLNIDTIRWIEPYNVPTSTPMTSVDAFVVFQSVLVATCF